MKHISEQLLGFLLLALFLIGAGVGLHVLNVRDTARVSVQEGRDHSRWVQDSLQQAHDSIQWARERRKQERDSLQVVWAEQRAQREAQKAQWAAEKAAREAEKHIEICLQPFDPNTADSSMFVHLGLAPWMARSVVHYREKGGRYRKQDDFRKVYGMTDSLFAQLAPYIRISDSLATSSASQKPLYRQKKDTILNLNTADTAQLQLLRGIGAYTALRIVRYRQQLGGYVQPNQLREITPPIKDLDSIIPHFVVHAEDVQPLAINSLSVEYLCRHPYLNMEQAKAIRDYRHRKGPIRSESTLLQLKRRGEAVFSQADLEKLRPYISYAE